MRQTSSSGVALAACLGVLLLIGWILAAIWPWLVAAMVVIGVGMALGRGKRHG